jgi:ribosomal protein S13
VLLDRGDAELAPGPYDTRSGQGYDRSELALQEIDGIGDATAQAVYAYLDARRIVRPDTLLEIDLNVLPDVDDDLAEDIRAHLSGEGAGDG